MVLAVHAPRFVEERKERLVVERFDFSMGQGAVVEAEFVNCASPKIVPTST